MDRPPLLKLLTFLPGRFRVLLPTGEGESLKNIVSRMNIFRAPTDCVQYFTGISGNVKNYNFAGSQVLQSQNYGQYYREGIKKMYLSLSRQEYTEYIAEA